MPRTCSFCKVEGHIIRKCNSPMIEEAQALIFAMVDLSIPLENDDLQRRYLFMAVNMYKRQLTDALLIRYTEYKMSKPEERNANLLRMVNREIEKFVALSQEEKQNYMQLLVAKIESSILVIRLLNTQMFRIEAAEHLCRKFPILLPIFVDYLDEHYQNNHYVRRRFGKIFRSWQIKPILCIAEDTNNHYNDDTECPICISNLSKYEIVKTNCGHIYCYPCMDIVFTNSEQLTPPVCSLCRGHINSIETLSEAVFEMFEIKWTKQCY